MKVAQSSIQNQRGSRRPSIILIIVGVLLFIFGLRIPSAQLLGNTAAGIITAVEPVSGSTPDQMDYNFNIRYSFSTAGGRTQSGSYMMMRVFDQSDLPEKGTTIVVRYLPVLAFVNFADGREQIGLSTWLTLILGAGIIILGASGVGRLQSGRKK